MIRSWTSSKRLNGILAQATFDRLLPEGQIITSEAMTFSYLGGNDFYLRKTMTFLTSEAMTS
jgi:hypothetical protein